MDVNRSDTIKVMEDETVSPDRDRDGQDTRREDETHFE
jgi:hypothetical protein